MDLVQVSNVTAGEITPFEGEEEIAPTLATETQASGVKTSKSRGSVTIGSSTGVRPVSKTVGS